MTQIKNFNYTESEISAITVDTYLGNYLWLAFQQDASGNCALQKVSASKPTQTYFNVDIAIDEIKKMTISSTSLYLAIDDSTYIGYKYSITNPLATPTTMTIPSGVNEAPIDVIVNGSYVYFLTPGAISGQNAKIVVFTTSGTFSETIDLATVTDASTFTFDGTDFWVYTDSSPVKSVRVYDDSGWTYSVENIEP